MSSMMSFRARPGATVRVVQTGSAISLHMEDSGISRPSSGTNNDLDIQVELNANGLSLCVVPTPELTPSVTNLPPQESLPPSSTPSVHGWEWPLVAEPNCANTLASKKTDELGIEIPIRDDSDSFSSFAMTEPELQAMFDFSETGNFTDESSVTSSPGPNELPDSAPNGSSSVPELPITSPDLAIVDQAKKKAQHPCRMCHRNFTREYTRNLHERAHAARAEPLRCREPNCNVTFSRSHDRLRHEVRIHDRPSYVCG
ncbi:hypothetical protein BT96DRAFT_1024347, partial [Gymnopus androsaceus JB14]